jgi:alkylation response protein AidB-like acyl-CoA dehydrogenase
MMTLSPETSAVIQRHAASAERLREMHPDVLALIYDRQWFRLMVPEKFGGRAMPLPQVVRLEEDISRADGSVGWTVTLCSGAGWFAGFFPASAEVARLFSDPQVCVAGSGSATGEAHLISGSYRISGRWAYASGAPHATAFTANCAVWLDGLPLLTDQGLPVIRPFLFRRSEVNVLGDWNAVGLVATASHGFEVSLADLPPERTFTIDASAAVDAAALYRYPFLQLAEATLVANLSGMGAHFLDCCIERFATRSGRLPAGAAAEMDRILEQGENELERLRAIFYDALDASWAALEGRGQIDPRLLEQVSGASRALAAGVRRWVDTLYPFAGLGAARIDTEINRVWRDLHTAGQHPLLVFGGA